MEKFSTVTIVVALAILDREGRVLMQQRPVNKQHGGLWEFPGGKLEAGETLGAAVVREIDEELGLAIDEEALFPISFAHEALGSNARQILLLLYGTRIWDCVAVAKEAGSAIRWVDADELAGLSMPPLDIPLAQAVIPLLGACQR